MRINDEVILCKLARLNTLKLGNGMEDESWAFDFSKSRCFCVCVDSFMPIFEGDSWLVWDTKQPPRLRRNFHLDFASPWDSMWHEDQQSVGGWAIFGLLCGILPLALLAFGAMLQACKDGVPWQGKHRDFLGMVVWYLVGGLEHEFYFSIY